MSLIFLMLFPLTPMGYLCEVANMKTCFIEEWSVDQRS